MKIFFVLMTLSSQVFAISELPGDYRTKTYPVNAPLVLEHSIGTNKVYLHVINYPGKSSDLFFFHMHMNEVTAKEAGENQIEKNGGTFMYLVHSNNDRPMKVKMNGRYLEFDPNRIFTDDGFKESLAHKQTPTEFAELKKFVDWIKTNIKLGLKDRSRYMVTALHNNTDDDVHGEMLSIKTEKKIIGKDNEEVHQNASWDIDNFYIATWKTTYDWLVSKVNPNISLRMARPRPIGYLSNWMIDENIEYINVETQHGDMHHNLEMVEHIQTQFH